MCDGEDNDRDKIVDEGCISTDIDGDGDRDGIDYRIFVIAYGLSSPIYNADVGFDNNGKIDENDKKSAI